MLHLSFAFRVAWAALLAAGLGFVPLRAAPVAVIVPPYLQPGDGSALDAGDVKVVAWMTEPVAADFRVEYASAGGSPRTTTPSRTPLRLAGVERYFLYAAQLTGLPLDADIRYEVRRDDAVIGGGTFHTRKRPDQDIRFIVTGDLASGDPGKFTIAREMAGARPDFLLVCGDIAYERGRVSEYLNKYWPVYNRMPGATTGESLMQSVVFYMALGNHDAELADLTKLPDAFAAFYFFHPPRNAPEAGSWRPFIPGPAAQVRDFESAASGAGYPNLCLYSFDDGPAHFLALDSNAYMPILSADYRAWIRRDLLSSQARWKFVFFHTPGFQSSAKHFEQQKMRLLAPLFEEAGVDVVFAGHVHNYQRSKPLHFAPKDALPELGLAVRGRFVLDEQFDGAAHTVPNGVIYIVTGGGGAELYAMMPNHVPGQMMADPDTPVTFTAKYLDDRHSFTVVDLEPNALHLRQLDERGGEADRITITKPAR